MIDIQPVALTLHKHIRIFYRSSKLLSLFKDRSLLHVFEQFSVSCLVMNLYAQDRSDSDATSFLFSDTHKFRIQSCVFKMLSSNSSFKVFRGIPQYKRSNRINSYFTNFSIV